MYNNDITYAEKHDTAENRVALDKLTRKYFDKSSCSPDCPVAWAPEVLELMETIDNELGFMHNESSMRGYYIQGGPINWFLKRPWSEMFSSFRENVFTKSRGSKKLVVNPGTTKPYYVDKTLFSRIESIVGSFFRPIKYGIKAIIITKVNPFRNRFEKRRVSLGQLKEKFGELRVYFSAPEAFDEFIEREIRKCEIKLAIKGVYYPVENFWDASVSYSVGTQYKPDIITTSADKNDGTINVTETQYRQIMKDLGLDLEDIKAKADIKQALKKAKEQSEKSV